jgi:hypothetical protein
MAQVEILSNWSKLFENFETSSIEFYGAVVKAIHDRKLPGVMTEEVTHHEGGLYSAKRIYLRVSRRRISYDICAAPYGTGFFFSSWMTKSRTMIGIWLFIGAVIASYYLTKVTLGVIEKSAITVFNPLYLIMQFFGAIFFPVALGLAEFLVLILFLGWLINVELIPGEESIMAIPVLGKIYEKIYHPVTYYKTDTALMFQTSVHSAMMQAIDEVTNAKGIRPLTELERKPIMKDFFSK